MEIKSIFNSTSTFVGYSMPKPFFQKNNSCIIQPIAGRLRGSCLSMSISPKDNVIASLTFELTTMWQTGTLTITTPKDATSYMGSA